MKSLLKIVEFRSKKKFLESSISPSFTFTDPQLRSLPASMEPNRENSKYLPKKKFYLTIEQLKQLDELKKQRNEVLTVDVERELKVKVINYAT